MLTETKIVINKRVKDVWDFFQNPDNLELWLSGFQKFEHISGIPGTVGAKAKHHFLERGKELILDGELTEVIEHKRIIGVLDSSMMLNKVTNSFHDLGNDQTEVTLSSDTQFKSFLWKQIGPLMKGEFKKRQERDLQTLKEILENNNHNPR